MDIVDRVRAAIHLESAAIAPQTSALIEAARCAADEIERLRAALQSLADMHVPDCPAALAGISNAEFVERHVNYMRRVARNALGRHGGGGGESEPELDVRTGGVIE